MENTMTYGEFVSMCENYKYSREYYDTMKEMAEIELMDRYLENQRFLGEEAVLYDFTEGVLFEAADENNKQAVKTSLGTKIKNVGKKILQGIKKVFTTLISFISKAANKGKEFIQKRFRSKKSKAAANIVNAAVTGKTPSNEAIVNFTGDDSIVSTDKTIPKKHAEKIFEKHWYDNIKIDEDFTGFAIMNSAHVAAGISDIKKFGWGNVSLGIDQGIYKDAVNNKNAIIELISTYEKIIQDNTDIPFWLDIDDRKDIRIDGKSCMIDVYSLSQHIKQFIEDGKLSITAHDSRHPSYKHTLLIVKVGKERDEYNNLIINSQKKVEQKVAEMMKDLENPDKQMSLAEIKKLQEQYTVLTKMVAIYIKGYNEVLRLLPALVKVFDLTAQDIIAYDPNDAFLYES